MEFGCIFRNKKNVAENPIGRDEQNSYRLTVMNEVFGNEIKPKQFFGYQGNIEQNAWKVSYVFTIICFIIV